MTLPDEQIQRNDILLPFSVWFSAYLAEAVTMLLLPQRITISRAVTWTGLDKRWKEVSIV